MELFNLIKSAILWAIKGFVDLIIALARPVLEPIVGEIPSFDFDFSFIDSGFFGFLNSFFPIDYFLGFLFAYLVLACVVYTVNWILGLVPHVS